MRLFLSIVLMTVLSVASPTQAAPSAAQICKKMIAEGRGGGLDQTYCQCMHRVAKATLDPDIQELLFDLWYNGTNNMKQLENLPNPARVKRQLKTMQRSLKPNCE